MPTYVYRREDGTTFEVVQRITEAPLSVDPESGQPVTRVISGAGLIFKGQGFYLTDYVKKKGSDDKAESKSSAKPGDKASDKPAAKVEAKKSETPAAA